ncbi:DUF3265 domain-containing protein [Vibrio splendidus]|nr:DUF3265 domain-containing protein [Vibrio splendidus]
MTLNAWHSWFAVNLVFTVVCGSDCSAFRAR